MSWGLVHWGMLAGLAGIAIPVVIHLLNRRKTTVVDWGAMQFLELGRRAQVRFQLSELLLLAGRMALLGIVALALARPFWIASCTAGSGRGKRGHGRPGFLGGPRRDIVLVIDASGSMGRRVGQTTPFDQASGMGETVDRQPPSRRLGRRAAGQRPGDAAGRTGQFRHEEGRGRALKRATLHAARATCRWPSPRRLRLLEPAGQSGPRRDHFDRRPALRVACPTNRRGGRFRPRFTRNISRRSGVTPGVWVIVFRLGVRPGRAQRIGRAARAIGRA